MSEALAIRMLNGATAANGAPSASTDGIAIPPAYRNTPVVHQQGEFSRSSGSASFRLRAWGYRPKMVDTSLAVVASSDAWVELSGSDTGVLTDSADWNQSWPIELADDYTRLYLELVSISGTGAAVNGILALSGRRR